MVGYRSKEDPKNHRQWAPETRSKHQRQDLGLIADLGQADDHGRKEERFHAGAIGVGREIYLGTDPSAQPGCRRPMPKVSPNLSIASAMAEAKCVDAGPALNAGGYSPMTATS